MSTAFPAPSSLFALRQLTKMYILAPNESLTINSKFHMIFDRIVFDSDRVPASCWLSFPSKFNLNIDLLFNFRGASFTNNFKMLAPLLFQPLYWGLAAGALAPSGYIYNIYGPIWALI